MQISVNSVFDDAWPTFKENMGMLIGVYFVEWIITAAFNFGGSFILGVMQGARVDEVLVVTLQLFHAIVNFVLSSWIACGRDLFVLQTAKGQSPVFTLLFGGHAILWRRILLTLLGMIVFAFVLAPAVVIGVIVYGVTQDEDPAFLAGLGIGVLSVIPIVWLSLTYGQAWYVFLDQPVGVIEALRISRQITPGNRLSLFAIGILSGLIVFLGACACYVGVFFAAPLAFTLAVVAYMQMSGQRVVGGPYVTPPRERALPAQPNF